MHDITLRPDSIVSSMDPPVAHTPTSAAFNAAIHARTPLDLATPGIVGDSVDIINNLTTGALVRKLAGVAPGPQGRVYELNAVPDFGTGSLALPRLERVGTRGTVAFVDDSGAAATGGAITGLSVTNGAYLKTSQPLPPSLDLGVGWTLRFSFRTPAGANNSSRYWVSIGRRDSEGTYGIQAGESSSGQLSATIQDPRFGIITVRSNVAPRNRVVDARLTWDPTTRQAQWFVDGVASGVPVAVTFKPDVATGHMLIGTNIGESTSGNPTGSIHRAQLELANVGVTDSYVGVPAVATLTAAEAATLTVDTLNFFASVPNAGTISARYTATDGTGGTDLTVSIDGYRNVVERLPRFVSAPSSWSSVELGTSFSGESQLVLTPPALGSLRGPSGSSYRTAGTMVGVEEDSGRPLIRIDPTGSGNPAGPITRGWTGIMRLQQRGSIREFPLTELNNAPMLNGGGEAWGHADDPWVPIHSLWYGYVDADYLYPTLPGETPTVTVTAVPGPGEGSIRVLRTGTDLRVGDTVPFTSVRRLGWAKAGVTTVSPTCRLGLRVSAPGAPDGNETYSLMITDAPRPAAFRYWGFPTVNFSDQTTLTRWANRGGDWTGADGLYGATPYVQTASLSGAQVSTIDVTAMVKVFGPEFYIILTSSGSVNMSPPSNPSNPAAEPVLRVTGGARAGDYRATRWGTLGDSDSTSWRRTYSSSFPIRRTIPTLLAFDGAGLGQTFPDATRVELVLTITGSSGGGGALQLFRPTPQPPRPGPRIAVSSTPIRSRSDFLVGVDRDEDWLRMINSASVREQQGGNPTNYTIANNCYYGAIPTGRLTGMGLFRGFWREDGSGYPVVRMGRMVGWHINYQPADTSANHPGVSGKTAGMIATGKAQLDGVDVGRGGLSVTGLGGYTCRGQRGKGTDGLHRSGSPLHPFMAVGDYNYYINGTTNGRANLGVAPIQRMQWHWIETVHATNTVFPDGRWLRDGVFELYVNGRKYCEYYGLEYRIAGNPWLWDAIWFDEYNGGVDTYAADRPWPFVVGPTYVVTGRQPIAPPADWNVPFVTADGRPDSTPLRYMPD